MDDFFESAEEMLKRQQKKLEETQDKFHGFIRFLAVKDTTEQVRILQSQFPPTSRVNIPFCVNNLRSFLFSSRVPDSWTILQHVASSAQSQTQTKARS